MGARDLWESVYVLSYLDSRKILRVVGNAVCLASDNDAHGALLFTIGHNVNELSKRAVSSLDSHDRDCGVTFPRSHLDLQRSENVKANFSAIQLKTGDRSKLMRFGLPADLPEEVCTPLFGWWGEEHRAAPLHFKPLPPEPGTKVVLLAAMTGKLKNGRPTRIGKFTLLEETHSYQAKLVLAQIFGVVEPDEPILVSGASQNIREYGYFRVRFQEVVESQFSGAPVICTGPGDVPYVCGVISTSGIEPGVATVAALWPGMNTVPSVQDGGFVEPSRHPELRLSNLVRYGRARPFKADLELFWECPWNDDLLLNIRRERILAP